MALTGPQRDGEKEEREREGLIERLRDPSTPSARKRKRENDAETVMEKIMGRHKSNGDEQTTMMRMKKQTKE